MIKKNKKENEPKNNPDINNDISDENNTPVKKGTPYKNEKSSNRNNYKEDNEENNERENINEKHINNFDDIPIKGMINNNNIDNSEQISKKGSKKNIINIDDLPVKGIANYDKNVVEKKKEPEKAKNNNIINIDDLPIKGVVNYNQNNDVKNEPETKKKILNIDELPIKGMTSNSSINNVIDINNKDEPKGDNNEDFNNKKNNLKASQILDNTEESYNENKARKNSFIHKEIKSKYQRTYTRAVEQEDKSLNKYSKTYQYKYYFIPKCICLISIHPYIKLFQEILSLIYKYSLSCQQIPIEKISP